MGRYGVYFFLWFIGPGMVVVAFQFFGQTMEQDAPINRALGAKGLPVVAKVVERTETYPKITTLQYVAFHRRYKCMMLQDPAVTQVPIGGEIALRADPQDPSIVVRADRSKPWTWSKLAGCIFVGILGGIVTLFMLAVAFSH